MRLADVAEHLEGWRAGDQDAGVIAADSLDQLLGLLPDLVATFEQLRVALPAVLADLPDFPEWRDAAFTDAAVIEGSVVVARAARWIYSDDAWELAGVFTVPERRGAGLSRSVCSFVTAAILSSGKTATCHAHPTNLAMRRVAESLGYTLLG